MPYDEKKAEWVINFIQEHCRHTKGKWAGKKFVLLDWEREIIHRLFGTMREDGKHRQYRFCYLEIPKKNGKSELGAALALYLTGWDHELGAEVYGAAADKEQAGIIYNVAKQMVALDGLLTRRLTVIDSKKRIVDYKTDSFYQVLSSETFTKHGINPHAIIFDELHAQPNDGLWNVLTAGTDYARSQQVVFVATTAGQYDPQSIWWRIRERAIRIKEGILQDDSFLPILYIADKEKDDPNDENLWIRVNPSIGHIFDIDKIREDYNIAKQTPIDFNNFLRFRLNIPVAALSRWIMPETWDECGGEISVDDLKGRLCYAGLDLSSNTDLTAFVLVFPPEVEGEKFIILPRFWIPLENLHDRVRRDRVPYDIWADQGFVTPTDGNVIDYKFIIHQIEQDSYDFNIQELCFDRWGATKIMQDLQELGFDSEDNSLSSRRLIQFGQGFASMSRPMKELQKMLLAKEVNHGNNPVLKWMASNVVVKSDPAGNIKPDKAKSIEKIDGIVALVMGLDRATMKNVIKSVYEEQRIEML